MLCVSASAVCMLWAVAALGFICSCEGVFTSGADEEIGSPLRVAQCRAQCIQRFSQGPNRESMCLQGPDCFMCWENCDLLQSNFPVWGAMCAEKGICFPGCQEACRFHRETSSQQLQPVIQTRGQEVVRLSAGICRWPRPPTSNPSSPLVYVLVRRSGASSSWRQVTQTVELSARLPVDSNASPGSIRVLVVDPDGLVTIYSPVVPAAPPSSSAGGAGAEVLNSKLASKVMAGHRKKVNTEVSATTTRSPLARGSGAWEIREVSLIHQKVLVIAEVAWEPRVTRGVYLVTWEVDGGGLRGNLFTDSTCVTLSLWPDTVYHIQVELVSRSADHRTERSQPLVIDTHREPRVASNPSFLAAARGRSQDSHEDAVSSPLLSVLVNRGVMADRASEERRQQMELLAATGTAVLLFLVVVGTLVWRCRKYNTYTASQATLITGPTTIKSKKLVEDLPPSARKGFQPVVAMVSETTGNTSRGVAGNLMASGRSSLSCGPSTASTNIIAGGGVLNPSLQYTSSWNHQSEELYTSTSSFLKAAERGARNEVQV